ncbi:MAG TPA: hypothetical protein VG733_20010 [Chthoniobacteraceae bacterium]|nr:hypothetical protein [Chthoniobacteraceae bacterium]
MNWNRILSGLLAAIYIVAAFAEANAAVGCVAVISVILPLACIWFGDQMGGFLGQSGSGLITERSPGVLVCIFGWLLLLAPMIYAAYNILAASKS